MIGFGLAMISAYDIGRARWGAGGGSSHYLVEKRGLYTSVERDG